MANVSRQQLIVERFLEDERLRGDLEDAPAKALLDWATAQAGPIAADETRSDADVDAAVQAIRKAAMQVAHSGESDPKKMLAQAAAALQAAPAPPQAAPRAAATLSEREAGAASAASEASPPPAAKPDHEQQPAAPAPPAAKADHEQQPAASAARAAKPERAPGRKPQRRRNRFAKLLKQMRGAK